MFTFRKSQFLPRSLVDQIGSDAGLSVLLVDPGIQPPTPFSHSPQLMCWASADNSGVDGKNGGNLAHWGDGWQSRRGEEFCTHSGYGDLLKH